MALHLRPCAPSNQPDTCLWCGEPLPHPRRFHARNARGLGIDRRPSEVGGYAENGYFCTVGCGYQFGLAVAVQGRRLQPRPEHVPQLEE